MILQRSQVSVLSKGEGMPDTYLVGVWEGLLSVVFKYTTYLKLVCCVVKDGGFLVIVVCTVDNTSEYYRMFKLCYNKVLLKIKVFTYCTNICARHEKEQVGILIFYNYYNP